MFGQSPKLLYLMFSVDKTYQTLYKYIDFGNNNNNNKAFI